MKKQFISSFVCLLFIVWLVSIFASCTMPGSHEPGDSTTTLTVYNNISNDFSLSLGHGLMIKIQEQRNGIQEP